jgi:hypothetical protein
MSETHSIFFIRAQEKYFRVLGQTAFLIISRLETSVEYKQKFLMDLNYKFLEVKHSGDRRYILIFFTLIFSKAARNLTGLKQVYI